MSTEAARTVAILGAGASGHAIAGFLGLARYQVTMWNRNDPTEVSTWLDPIKDRKAIQVHGILEGEAPIQLVTTDIAEAISAADVILVNTTTDAYQAVGRELAPHIRNSQSVILMAAGTLGSLDFWRGLADGGYTDELLVGETSTTVFGSRVTEPASVRIGGRKEGVELSTLPHGRASELGALVPEFNFVPGDDILWSGFNNVGPILHVVPMVLNAGRVEAEGGKFLYYVDGITEGVATVLERFDDERIAVAKAFGYTTASIAEYLRDTVGAPEGTVYESIQGCTMYSTTPSPAKLNHRFLWEDAMAGAVPFLSLAEVAGVDVPITRSLITMASTLLGKDLSTEGRTMSALGLENATTESLKEIAQGGEQFNQWKNASSSTLASL